MSVTVTRMQHPRGGDLESKRVYVPSARGDGVGAVGTVKMYDFQTESCLVILDTGERVWCGVNQIVPLKQEKR